jgi:hypothetical protein
MSNRVYCWGRLVKVERPKVEQTLESQLAHARAKLSENLTKARRATTLATKWKRRAAKLAGQILEQGATTQARTVIQLPGRTRHIELED